MSENEAIALERIAISARKLLGALDAGWNVKGPLASLRQDTSLLDSIRTPAPLPTAKEIIENVIKSRVSDDFYKNDGFGVKISGDIHEALVEAGYL